MPNINSFDLPRDFLIVGAAVKTGLFDVLQKEECTSENLAKKTDSDPRAVWTVAESLVALGYLEYHGGNLRLTEKHDRCSMSPAVPTTPVLPSCIPTICFYPG